LRNKLFKKQKLLLKGLESKKNEITHLFWVMKNGMGKRGKILELGIIEHTFVILFLDLNALCSSLNDSVLLFSLII